jgi:hypothetical protein
MREPSIKVHFTQRLGQRGLQTDRLTLKVQAGRLSLWKVVSQKT